MSLKIHVEKVLEGFNLKIDLETEDVVTGLLGYSGSGKSITLKMIAGIILPDRGMITLNNRVLFDSRRGINLKPQERNVGLMFQSYALFNHMSVYDNIAIGMKGTKEEKEKRIRDYLKFLELEELERKKPKALSGGQKQRVALARMLAQEPDLLMLDEPFSALDSHLRQTLEEPFQKALEAFKGSVLYVSHNKEEVYQYCQEVAIISEGRVIEQNRTETIFKRPTTLTGARLTGRCNVAPLTQIDAQTVGVEAWGLKLEGLTISDDIGYVGIRESDLVITPYLGSQNHASAQVGKVMALPDKVRIELYLEDGSKLLYSCSRREYEGIEEILGEQKVGIVIDTSKLLFLRD